MEVSTPASGGFSIRISGYMPRAPFVFISSTSDDLKKHREQAALAARACGFASIMMEDFAPTSHAPSLPACLEKVAQAEVVIVLVAHRYGWVPDGPGNPDGKSITCLECEHALGMSHPKEVLAFLVDPAHPRPVPSWFVTS